VAHDLGLPSYATKVF